MRLLAPVLTIILAATACGGGDAAGTGGASATGTPVAVSERDFSIELPHDSLAPGTYTFDVTNEGTLPHDLAIAGPGLGQEISDTIAPGESGSLTVTLEEGTYTLWCTVGDHRSRGMETMIEVAG